MEEIYSFHSLQVYKQSCVKCQENFPSKLAVLEHMKKAQHFALPEDRTVWDQPQWVFSISKWCMYLPLQTKGQKKTKYMEPRKTRHENQWNVCAFLFRYFFPTYENDALLCSLEDDEEDEETADKDNDTQNNTEQETEWINKQSALYMSYEGNWVLPDWKLTKTKKILKWRENTANFNLCWCNEMTLFSRIFLL